MPANRTRAKLVRLTPEEFAEIERRARAAGTVPARYLRAAALTDGAAPSHRPTASADLLHALAAVGADLKALARSTADEPTRANINSVLAELVAALRQLARPEHP